MDPSQAALASEIARLSGAINSHRRGRGAARARGARGRGARRYMPSRHRSLSFSRSGTEPTGEAPDAGGGATGAAAGDWVKRRSNGSIALVNASVYEADGAKRAAAKPNPRGSARQGAPPRGGAPSHGPSLRRGPGMGEVLVDGVPFMFDETGTKLVKKSTMPTEPSSTPSTSATPLRASVNGEAYVRTKSGNLISRALVEERRAARAKSARMARLAALGRMAGERHRKQPQAPRDELCAFFSRTGACRRGSSCPYKHDANKVAICPGALKPSGCTQPPGTCLLSHKRTPERVPHCVHFVRSGSCRNGDKCPYTHAERISPQTPICRSFARLGWCDAGAKCERRHTWECPDYAETGQCPDRNCRLAHVARATSDAAGEQPATRPPSAAAPTEDTLFVRDDIAATEAPRKRKQDEADESDEETGDEEAGDLEETDESEDETGWRYAARYYTGVDKTAHDLIPPMRTSRAFAQQRDYIGLDDEEDTGSGAGSEPASPEHYTTDEVSSDTGESDVEVDQSLGA